MTTYNIAIRKFTDPTFGPLITGLPTPHYHFDGLTPATMYVYEISSTSNGVTSPFTTGFFTTTGTPPDVSVPTPPPPIPPGPPIIPPTPPVPTPPAPPISPTPGPPSLTESPDGTSVTTVGPAIIDQFLEAFTLTGNGQVAVNGATDTETSNVIELDYFNHLVYHENSTFNWYSKARASDQWVLTPAPTDVPTAVTISSATVFNNITSVSWTPSVGTAPITYAIYMADVNNVYTLLGEVTDQTQASFAIPVFAPPPTPPPAPPPTPLPLPTPVSPPSPVPSVPLPTPTTPTPTTGLRKWYENPGMNGSFWVKPFQTTAQWTTSGSQITLLRNGVNSQPTGYINLAGNYAVPWYIGRASDPIVTVTDGHKSIQVHMPAGAVVEGPVTSVDCSVGGSDVTQPYLIWSISGATMNTGSVQASGSVITGTYGFQIADGAGPIMEDRTTGQAGDNNSIGNIQDFELSYAAADSNYKIQHMLAFQMDPRQAAPGSAGTLAWPLNAGDGGATYTGSIPQGITIGIPSYIPRPTGKSRGFYLLFDNLREFGWFNYNFGAAGCTFITAYQTLPSNAALMQDLSNSISDVMQYVCILANQTDHNSSKGSAPGGVDAFPAPPSLDLSPTGGVNVSPSTFGAWYPSGYNVTPTNATTTPTPTPNPTPTVPTTPAVTRHYYDQPGTNNCVWNIPLGSGAIWGNASDADTQSLRIGGFINPTSNYGAVVWISKSSSDPLIRFTGTGANYDNGTNGTSFDVTAHCVPGSYASGPFPGDNQYAFIDTTGHPGIYYHFAPLAIQGLTAGSGPYNAFFGGSEDAMSDTFATDWETKHANYVQAAGLIRAYDLDPTRNLARMPGTSLTAIQHMLRYAHAPSSLKANANPSNSDYPNGPLQPNSWPQYYQDYQSSSIPDNFYTGSLVYGTTVGIPSNIAMPSNLTNAGKQIWWTLQHYGAITRDAAAGGFHLYADQDVPQSWIDQANTDFGTIVPFLCPLRNQHQGGQSFTTNPINGPGTRLDSGPPPLAST